MILQQLFEYTNAAGATKLRTIRDLDEQGVAEMDNRTHAGDRREQRANSPEAQKQREKEFQDNLKKTPPELRKKLRLPEPKDKGVSEGSDLPPKVIEMIKKIAQSSASPEHKKAAIDALVAKYSKKGVAEGRYKPPKNTYYVMQTSINSDEGRSVDVFDLMYNGKIIKRYNLLASADRQLRRLRAAGNPVQIDEQGVAEGSGPKEKQKTPYRDINSPEYRKAADKQKQQMAKDAAAEPGKKLADKIAKKGVAEGSEEMVGFHLDSERAYQAVMKRFGHVIDHDENSGTMYVPERLWPTVEAVAYDADGIGAQRDDDLENPEHYGVAEGRFDEPLTGWHIVYRNSGNPVHATPSFETKEQAQKYLMTKMFANHQDFKVVHTAGVGMPKGSFQENKFDDIESKFDQQFGTQAQRDAYAANHIAAINLLSKEREQNSQRDQQSRDDYRDYINRKYYQQGQQGQQGDDNYSQYMQQIRNHKQDKHELELEIKKLQHQFDMDQDSKTMDILRNRLDRYNRLSQNPEWQSAMAQQVGKENLEPKKAVAEAGMPASVVKSKQRYSQMTPEEFARAHADKSDDILRAMAWRHGYGKGSNHYVDKRNKGKQGVAEGSSGAKYKVKSIGKDSRGDYYISPSTGKKVYKKARVGDHENPRTGELKAKVSESDISGILDAAKLVKDFIVTAEVDGDTKKFRVRGMTGPNAAKDRFLKHHSMAKILNVKQVDKNMSEADMGRRGFLRGLGAAALGAAGMKAQANQEQDLGNGFVATTVDVAGFTLKAVLDTQTKTYYTLNRRPEGGGAIVRNMAPYILVRDGKVNMASTVGPETTEAMKKAGLEKMQEGVTKAGSYGRNPEYMSPSQYDRYQQQQMDYDKRSFKRNELQHELGHEDEQYRREMSGTWFIRINGKLLKDKQGNPYTFRGKSAANKAALTMMAKPFNKGKDFKLTTNPIDV